MIKWLKSKKAKIAARIHQILKGMCEVILPLSRSAVWKGDKVHYAHLHLAPSSPEIWENKITPHLRLWHSTKSTCAHIYSSIYSQMPFPKGQKGIFYFLSLWMCFSVCFLSAMMREHKSRCDRGQSKSAAFTAKAFGRAFSLRGAEVVFASV